MARLPARLRVRIRGRPWARPDDDRLELFFSQSLDGFFFMTLDESMRVELTRPIKKRRYLSGPSGLGAQPVRSTV